MPRHPDFEEVYQNFLRQYGEQGEELYYKWLQKSNLDDTKPMPKREGLSWFGSIQEARADLSWAGDLSAYPPKNIIYGVAIHPIKTVHPEEWPSTRVYLEEEIVKFTPTLKGAPLIYDHLQKIPEPYKVLATRYNPETAGVEYVAYAPDWIAQKVRDGKIKNASIEYDWRLLQNVNGVAPRGMRATGLGILEHILPGDPQASVMVWESIVRQLKEAKGLAPPSPKPAGEGSETEVKQRMGVKREPLWERVWSYRYKYDLPDAAYAFIKPGGERENGKTRPQSLRYFPHHRADGSLDPVHIRNANSRVPVSDLTAEQKAEAKRHLDAHKKALGIGEFAEAERVPFKHAWKEQEEIEIEFQVAPEPTMDELIESVEEFAESVEESIRVLANRVNRLEKAVLGDVKAQAKPAEVEEAKRLKGAPQAEIKLFEQQRADLQRQVEELNRKRSLAEAVIQASGPQPISDLISRREVLRRLEAITPADFVVRAHGVGGFLKLVQDLKRVRREIEGAEAS